MNHRARKGPAFASMEGIGDEALHPTDDMRELGKLKWSEQASHGPVCVAPTESRAGAGCAALASSTVDRGVYCMRLGTASANAMRKIVSSRLAIVGCSHRRARDRRDQSLTSVRE